ncbi:MAG TPA: hypothetical protein VFN89_03065 [Solirubrobacterales bacterium]|nr:hypothetical protein [Solirubrobacterales bacterium]
MVRQARNYLAGAVSGTALIGGAVVVFVMLVSLQGLRDWPLAALNGGEDSGGATVAPAGAAVSGPRVAPGTGRVANAAAGATGATNRSAPDGGGEPGQRRGSISPGAGSPGAGSPDATAPASAPGSQAGSDSPSAPAAGDSAAGGSAPTPGSPGGSTKPSGSGNGGSVGAGGGSGSPSASATVAETVDGAVSGVDEATGGTLGKAGVTDVGEEVTSKAVGPESVVGETVDKSVEAVQETVGGLLGGGG